MASFDFPAWVQAIGSILAILAAIRISRAEDRRRRRAELSAAAVTAVLVRSMLLNIRAAVVKAKNARTEISQSASGVLEFAKAAQEVLTVAVPSEDQLIRLTASDATGAGELAELCSRLDRVRQLLPTMDWKGNIIGDHGPGGSATDSLVQDLGEIGAMAMLAYNRLSLFQFDIYSSREEAELGKAESVPKRAWAAFKDAFHRIWP